jgi:hypothetical protein
MRVLYKRRAVKNPMFYCSIIITLLWCVRNVAACLPACTYKLNNVLYSFYSITFIKYITNYRAYSHQGARWRSGGKNNFKYFFNFFFFFFPRTRTDLYKRMFGRMRLRLRLLQETQIFYNNNHVTAYYIPDIINRNPYIVIVYGFRNSFFRPLLESRPNNTRVHSCRYLLSATRLYAYNNFGKTIIVKKKKQYFLNS